VLGRELAAAAAAVAGCIGLSALRFLAAFRLENPRLEQLRGAYRATSVLLLALLPWLPTVIAARGWPPPVTPMAFGLCLATTILIARWLYAELGAARTQHWLLPDGDQAWLGLAFAAAAGFLPVAIAVLPLLALLQLLAWLRLARRKANRV
jgi:hypothetical protein